MSPRRKPAFQDFQEFSEPVPCALVLEGEPVPYQREGDFQSLSLLLGRGDFQSLSLIRRACPLSESDFQSLSLVLGACP